MRDYQIFKPLFLSRTQVITIREVHNQAVPNGKYWQLPTAALPASGSRVSSQLRLVATGDNGSAPL